METITVTGRDLEAVWVASVELMRGLLLVDEVFPDEVFSDELVSTASRFIIAF